MLRSATHAEFEELMLQLEELQQEEEADDAIESEKTTHQQHVKFQSGQRAAIRRLELLEAKKAQKAMQIQRAAVEAKKVQLKKNREAKSADPEDRNTLIDKAAAEQLAEMEKLLRSLEEKATNKVLAAIASKKEELEEESEADCRQARPARNDSRTKEGTKATTSENIYFDQKKPPSIYENCDPYGNAVASTSRGGAMHFHLGSEARVDAYIPLEPDVVQRAGTEGNVWKCGKTAVDHYDGGHAGASEVPKKTDKENLGSLLHGARAPVAMVEFAFNGKDLRRDGDLRAEKSEPVLPLSRKPMKKWVHDAPESPRWIPRAENKECAAAGSPTPWKFTLDGDHTGSQDLGPNLKEKITDRDDAASRKPWRTSSVVKNQLPQVLIYEPNLETGVRDDLDVRPTKRRDRMAQRSHSVGPMDNVEQDDCEHQSDHHHVHSVQTDRPRRNRFVSSLRDHVKRFAARCGETATETSTRVILEPLPNVPAPPVQVAMLTMEFNQPPKKSKYTTGRLKPL